MRVLIYSDVHGNLLAFETMLRNVGTCDLHICLGDLVNYGPWSNECVDLAVSLPNSILLMGNHEEAFIQGFYPGKNELVKKFFVVTIEGFSRIESVKRFSDVYELDNYTCTHTVRNEYIYPDTLIPLDKDYIIGHSHHQFRYTYGPFVLYNAGSVGQDRKYINMVDYLVYDMDTKVMEMKKDLYPVDQLISEMRSRKYPEECIAYYMNKERA